MTVTTGVVEGRLIDRGVCLENLTCDCEVFYEGSSCGTYKGCPAGLDAGLCDTLHKISVVQKTNLPNNTVSGREEGLVNPR